MDNIELQKLRRLLFLSVAEASELIGGCEPRSWQRWEDGTRGLKPDVAQAIKILALTRQKMLDIEPKKGNPEYQYFDKFADYKAAGGGGSKIEWRMAQSISAQLFSEKAALSLEIESGD